MVNVLLSTGIVSAGEFASFKGGVNRKIEQGLIFDFFDWDKGCKAPNKGVEPPLPVLLGTQLFRQESCS